MMLREVTIGRSKDCDIYLDERCIYASSHHATIYYDGNQLMYRDCSSNGTMINNVSVKHRAVPIRRGDTIMVAGKYQISWNQIDVYFPGRPQQQMAPQQSFQQPFQQSYQQPAMQAPVDEGDSLNLSKWNWGAFSLYPLWGFFNGCWWAFLIGFFVGWLFPIPNIIFGVYGTRWAWQNRSWRSAADFMATQHGWDIAGIIIFVLDVLAFLSVFLFYAALISALS